MKNFLHNLLLIFSAVMLGAGFGLNLRLTELEREVFHLRTHERVLEKELNKGIHCVMCVEYNMWSLKERRTSENGLVLFNKYESKDEEHMVIVNHYLDYWNSQNKTTNKNEK